jgi:hypothetical protein
VRTIIELPDDQLEALDGICKRDGISRAEAVRQAVTLLMRQRGASRSGVAFGIWRGRRNVGGLAYQERLRREWADRAAGRKDRTAGRKG